jgi:uncharacterized protein (TIGR00255 family)
MTGFARARGELGGDSWVWEVKSVNARGLDIRVRLPAGHDEVETRVRDAIGKRFRRGAFSANLNLQRADGQTPYQVNRELLDHLIAVARELRDGEPDVETLLAVRGVVAPAEVVLDEDEEAARRGAYIASFETALDGLDTARREEGERLAAILEARLIEIEALVEEAEAEAAARPDAMRERLDAQLAEILGGTTAVPEERLAQELAIIAVKSDVREEIDRLGAHVAQGRDLLGEREPVGRRLDFLCQEFNREANTLCAKSNDVALTRIGLSLKAVIDQLREQVQNVE